MTVVCHVFWKFCSGFNRFLWALVRTEYLGKLSASIVVNNKQLCYKGHQACISNLGAVIVLSAHLDKVYHQINATGLALKGFFH